MALFGKTTERWLPSRSRSAGFGAPVADTPADRVTGAALPGGFPGRRDLRAQAVHRLQVGMFGLAAMLLLVSLASVIMQRVQSADRSTIAPAPVGSASAAGASDPLVDLGVAPQVPVGNNDAPPVAVPLPATPGPATRPGGVSAVGTPLNTVSPASAGHDAAAPIGARHALPKPATGH